MLDWITTCASCGAELDYPCDPRDAEDGAGYRAHCDACNARFDAAMRELEPYGSCHRCGGVYHPTVVECARCEGEGELVVLDGGGYQYGACGRCGGAGAYTELTALHEETICGYPHGEPRDWPRPTHVERLAWAREIRDDRRARDAAADAWRANLAAYSAAHADPDAEIDDLPF